MTPRLVSALMPFARRLDPELAHGIGIRALACGLAGRDNRADPPALATKVLGMSFRNPIGLAAGFDKNAVVAERLGALGFGFIETGTVTPRPQSGNPRPRLFRLVADRAVINRFGFNNDGLDAYVARLAVVPKQREFRLGANVGVNKTGADPERDYPTLVAAVSPHVDYVVINVSSPNTPGLRDLQGEARLRAILEAVAAGAPGRPPLLVKVAPDLGDAALEAIVETAVATGVDGLIVSNTTVSRPGHLLSPKSAETGGLSGAPLFAMSTAMLARVRRLAGHRLALIGVGGVATGAQALAKLRAGADLVQVYTAFVYDGPAMVGRIKRELAEEMRKAGFVTVAEVRDAADAPPI